MNLEQTQQEVIVLICNYFQIRKDQMFCKRRKREFVDARFMYALWLRENTKKTYKDIGSEISDIPKDHTSIIHAIQEARNLLDKDSGFNKRYNSLPVYVYEVEDKRTRINGIKIEIHPNITSMKFKTQAQWLR